MLKLNLGCGRLQLPGFTNVDSNPARKPDVVADMVVWAAGQRPHTCSEVRMVHSFEHVPYPAATRLLGYVFDCLVPKGILVIEVPDLWKAAKYLSDHPGSVGSVMNIFGHFAHKGEVEHRWAYTEATLTAMMTRAGFVGIHEDAKTNYAHPRLGLARDIRVVGVKP